ncbi:MAG TPA: DUF2188 domain-containing protein [Longimicrobium sp.]|nr:DUF2188 domain-containing protein [Longimicrobium sp.]
MAKQKSVHVVPSPSGGWSVKNSGSVRASKNFDTKEQAVKWGRARSKEQGTEFFIHRQDGTIQQKSSHGKDPIPPRDRDTHKPA